MRFADGAPLFLGAVGWNRLHSGLRVVAARRLNSCRHLFRPNQPLYQQRRTAGLEGQ
jgi:hypothetical protein